MTLYSNSDFRHYHGNRPVGDESPVLHGTRLKVWDGDEV